MLNNNALVIVASVTVFIAVASVMILIGSEYDRRRAVRNRLKPVDSVIRLGSENGDQFPTTSRKDIVADHSMIISLVSEDTRTKLRSDLIRAGYFEESAPVIYIGVTILMVLLFSALGLIVVYNYLGYLSGVMQLLALITFSYAGYFVTDIFLRARTTQLQQDYAKNFPDFLDLLVVCIDAGLSLNAALDRVTTEFFLRSKPLATNFSIMLQEIRIGRDISDALDNLSSRIDVAEIRSFCTLIKQSLELGSDVSDALRVYSEEMRTKRILKAEEEANKLPVKMLLPLGLFIFPVIMIVILLPIVIKISKAMN